MSLRGCPSALLLMQTMKEEADKEGKKHVKAVAAADSVEHVKLGKTVRQFVDWLGNLTSSANEQTT